MVTIDIVDAGPQGCCEYHVRTHSTAFKFDKDARALSILIHLDFTLHFVNVQLEDMIDGEIILTGSEPLQSGTGELPPLRRIHIRLVR